MSRPSHLCIYTYYILVENVRTRIFTIYLPRYRQDSTHKHKRKLSGVNISKNLKTILSSIRNLDSHFSTSEVLTPCIYLSFKTELFQEITFVAHEKFKNTYKVYSLFFKPLLTPLSFMCVCRIESVQKYW